MLDEFIAYLEQQIGQPYLWSGQHTLLTPNNYISVIDKKEANTGGYKGGPTYSDAVKAFCEKKFADGVLELFAYDCSGLGVYWLYNLMKIYKGDCNANTMMKRCEIRTEDPKRGWWVFCVNDKGKATHVGYMVSDTEVIEAKGRKYGVVKSKFKKTAWDKWGIPAVFKDEIEHKDPKPEPEKKKMIKVKGSVRVREGNGTRFDLIPPTARNCLLEYLGQADEDPYWYETHWQGQHAFISSNPKYTEIVEVEV